MRHIIEIEEGTVKYTKNVLKVYNYKGKMVHYTFNVDKYLDNLGISVSLRYEEI